MKFTPLPLPGAWLIEAEPICDERGFFSRIICREEFLARELDPNLQQASMSQNKLRGTLRGMHLQVAPHGETKLVRVTAGSIHDVIIDLRLESETYLQHFSVVLTSANPAVLYIPEGFAHGFQTLEDGVEVYYHMNRAFHAPAARGFLWSDPHFGITWPIADPILSPKDAVAPLFDPLLLAAI
ncbi:MAG: dTDP-4-dehydrorhamnose 3,5-epimerase family protein [Chthoniobacterales bacterium]